VKKRKKEKKKKKQKTVKPVEMEEQNGERFCSPKQTVKSEEEGPNFPHHNGTSGGERRWSLFFSIGADV